MALAARLTNFLTRPLSRRALSKPNLAYLLWRFVANGARTCRALTTRTAWGDTRAIARELKAQGLVVDRSDRFLSSDGARALKEVSDRVLKASRDETVESAIASSREGQAD